MDARARRDQIAGTRAGVGTHRRLMIARTRMPCCLRTRSTTSSPAAPPLHPRCSSSSRMIHRVAPALLARIGTSCRAAGNPQLGRPADPYLTSCRAAGNARGMASMMNKAIFFDQPGGPEVLQLREVELPVPAEGEVVVRNEFIGVNFIDTYIRSGLYPAAAYPAGLGEEGAGTVAAVGPGVSGLAVGDRVGYVTRSARGGSYADFTRVDTRSAVAARLPDGVSTRDAAAVLLQGLTALSQATVVVDNSIQPGDWVLVHAAAGGTGQLLVAVCRQLGARVIGTTSSEDKARVARAAGAEEVILYTQQQDVAARVLELTGGKGVKVVFDGVGKDTLDVSLKSLAYKGWMISFGNASGKPEPLELARLSAKSLRVMRPSLFSTLAGEEPATAAQMTKQLLEWVRGGELVPQVHAVYPLSQAAAAQADLAGRKTTGKLLLRPDGLGA